MASAREDIEFLARSETRLEVLRQLRDGSRTRDELRSAVDRSRVTVGRILGDLESRGWVAGANHRYEITPRGSFVVDEFSRLLTNVDAADELSTELAWIPTDKFGFPLDRLRDADIVTPTRSDPAAAIRAVADATRSASWIRSTAAGISPDVLDAFYELTVDGDGTLELVLSQEASDVVRSDAAMRERFRAVLTASDSSVYEYPGPRPVLMVLVTEAVTQLCGHDGEGPPPGTVETTDRAVRSWALGYVETMRDDARELDVEAFTG